MQHRPKKNGTSKKKNERPNYNSNSHQMEVFSVFFHSKATISMKRHAFKSGEKELKIAEQIQTFLFSPTFMHTHIRIFVCGDSNFFCRHSPLMLDSCNAVRMA